MIAHHFLEIEEETNLQDTKGVSMRILIGQMHGASNFYMRRFTVDKHGNTPRHKHPWEHEIYVLSGSGTVYIGEEHSELRQGVAVFIPPDVEHQIKAGKIPLEFLCMIPAPLKA